MREERARVQFLPVVKELVLRILSGHVINSLEYSKATVQRRDLPWRYNYMFLVILDHY